jgi:adenylosuccinate synthase
MAQAFVVAGIGYGDEGKGTITDALVRRHGASLVVRYNGGAQAAHNVVTPHYVHHTFAQFGSGALAGAATFIGEHVVVDPGALVNERQVLAHAGGCLKITIDPRARLVTPFHVALNRIRETARGDARHGSTGRGIGETVCDSKVMPDHAIRAADILRPGVLAEKLDYWRGRKEQDARAVLQEYRDARNILGLHDAVDAWFGSGRDLGVNWMARCRQLAVMVSLGEPDAVLPRDGAVVFEGAQGVLLDETAGFHPYSTWSNTTFDHAFEMLHAVSAWDIRRIGITRAYVTRHGPGPLPTEDEREDPGSEYNKVGPWQGPMRYGAFDLATAGYAVDVLGGVDELAVTCLDHLSAPVRVCHRYRLRGGQTVRREDLRAGRSVDWTERLFTATPEYVETTPEAFCDLVGSELGAPVTIQSYGPAFCGKRWAR